MIDESSLDRMSIGDLKRFSDALGLGALANSIRRASVSSYPQFIETLYVDLNNILLGMQENPELRKNDGEDRLTIEIVCNLRTLGYNASHDAKIGGHADILVRGKDNYIWIGEAKIHSGYDYLFQGFQQLCTRYSTGDAGQDCGALIIYIRNKNSSNVVAEWRQRITGYGLDNLSLQDCAERPEFVFYSTHTHERTSTSFNVKHIGVSLYFDPKDHAD